MSDRENRDPSEIDFEKESALKTLEEHIEDEATRIYLIVGRYLEEKEFYQLPLALALTNLLAVCISGINPDMFGEDGKKRDDYFVAALISYLKREENPDVL